MTNHHEEPAPLPAMVWAAVLTILLVAAVAIFMLVLIPLVASRITTGRRQALARHPNSSFGARLHTSLTRRSDFPFRGKPENTRSF